MAKKKPTKTEELLRNSDKSLPLLDVQDLTVEFVTRRGIVRAVQHINISVAKGESLAIVGESGSGKSVTSYAVMRILDRAGRITDGTVMF
ncbi:MAG: ATP-binding cassette domain-containing protein, partial [Pseudolabrys sp.]